LTWESEIPNGLNGWQGFLASHPDVGAVDAGALVTQTSVLSMPVLW
jgi:hypothetical protein